MELLCLSTALLALLLALGLTPLVRLFALRLGFLDQPGPRKIHSSPMPYGGGLAVLAAMFAALAVSSWVVQHLLYDPDWAIWRARLSLSLTEWRGAPEVLARLRICLLGASGVLVLGLVDDRRPLSPNAKLAGQFVCAIAAVVGGVRLTVLIGDNLFTQTATVLWIVLLTNSFNLLDNMDGLCAGVGAIAAALLGLVALTTGQAPQALALAALAGACLGFLKWNLSPARIFLGDTGSMFVGFLLACLSVITTYYHYHESVLSLGVPLLILAIPLYDTASVLVIRIREGRAILPGDTSHFSHRLVDLGMTHREAVATIHLAALAIGLPAVVLAGLSTAQGLLLVGQSLLILTVIALLERAGRTKRAGR